MHRLAPAVSSLRDASLSEQCWDLQNQSAAQGGGFCRDYTNPYLPVSATGQDPNLSIQAPHAGAAAEGNVLLCAVNHESCWVTCS